MLEKTIFTLTIITSFFSLIVVITQLIISNSKFKRKVFDTDLFESITRVYTNFNNISTYTFSSSQNVMKYIFSDIQKISIAISSQALITSIIINSNIIKKVQGLEKSIENEKENKKGVIISTLFLEQKLKKLHKSYFVLLVSAIFSLILSVSVFLSFFICLLLILTFTYQFLLSYRIKNGLFGNNPYEAKELLEFIIQNNDKIGRNGERLFNEEIIHNIVMDFSDLIKNGGKFNVI